MFYDTDEYIKISSRKECYRALLVAIMHESCNVAERAFDLLNGINRSVSNEIIDKIIELRDHGHSFTKIDQILGLGRGSSRYYYVRYQRTYQTA